MNKDQVKGAVDDAAGRIKRQAGEWAGNPNAQVEGAGQQIKGKTEKAWGNVKDAVQKEADERREHERERERNAAGGPHQEHSHHG
jgi:uncharacterized protein YjbJ (UPF0337 family)